MSDAQLQQSPDQGIDSGRREFVKKAAYSAPVLVALGFAAHSKQAHGQIGGSGPPPPPDTSLEATEDELLFQELERKD